jgi:hypothetical protein
MLADRIRAVWEIELDRLELDVIRAERLLKGLQALPTEPWCPPVVPGPMPADLAQRARDLMDRQDRTAARLRESLAAAQQQITYADRVTEALSRPTAPVYLDVEA